MGPLGIHHLGRITTPTKSIFEPNLLRGFFTSQVFLSAVKSITKNFLVVNFFVAPNSGDDFDMF